MNNVLLQLDVPKICNSCFLPIREYEEYTHENILDDNVEDAINMYVHLACGQVYTKEKKNDNEFNDILFDIFLLEERDRKKQEYKIQKNKKIINAKPNDDDNKSPFFNDKIIIPVKQSPKSKKKLTASELEELNQFVKDTGVIGHHGCIGYSSEINN